MKAIIALTVLVLFSSVSNAQVARCSDLTGKAFNGAEDNNDGISESGCEGCGSDGYIEFSSPTAANVVWIGSDVMETCTYKVSYPTVAITCGTAPLPKFSISKDCNTLRTRTGLKFSYTAPAPQP
jgi:hypothetical protein